MTDSTFLLPKDYSSSIETRKKNHAEGRYAFSAVNYLSAVNSPFRLDINSYYWRKLDDFELLYNSLLKDGLAIQKTFTDDRIGPISEHEQLTKFNTLLWGIALNPSLGQFNEVMQDPRSQMNERNLARMSKLIWIEQKMLYNALCIRYIYNALAKMRSNESTEKDFLAFKETIRRLRFNYAPFVPISLGKDRHGHWKTIAERTNDFQRFFKYPKTWMPDPISSGQVSEQSNVYRADVH